MLVTGLSLDRFVAITARVSDEKYGGNVIAHPDARALSGNRFQGRIYVQSSRGQGARRSSSGRRIPAACWHAYRDVLMAVFDEYPDARVRTRLATYWGRDGFMRDYPATGERNIGSMMQPATMPELCECDGNAPEVAQRARVEMARTVAIPSMHYLSPDSMTPDTSQPYLLDAIDDVIREAKRVIDNAAEVVERVRDITV